MLEALPVGSCTIADAGQEPNLALNPSTGITWRQVTVDDGHLGWVIDQGLRSGRGQLPRLFDDCNYGVGDHSQTYSQVTSYFTASAEVVICQGQSDGQLLYRGLTRQADPPHYITLPAATVPSGYEASVQTTTYRVTDRLVVTTDGRVVTDDPFVPSD